MANRDPDTASSFPHEEEEGRFSAPFNEDAMKQVSQLDRFVDLEELQFITTEGIDTHGRRILRIVGKFFPAPIVERVRLKDYIILKISEEMFLEEPFCIVYFHAQVNRTENCPGMLNLRWIYESLPEEYRERLETLYFVHPGLVSKTVMATFGRFLSNGLYEKVVYITRLEFLWDKVRRGQVEVPDFVFEHDEVLENRPLMDYWIDADPFGTLSASSATDHGRRSRWMT